MNKPMAYLETSFVSYLTGRVSADEKVALDQSATRRWWEEEGAKWHVVVSDVVRLETMTGDSETLERRCAFLARLESVETTDEARQLRNMLVGLHALFDKDRSDALHVALAAIRGVDLLLTWNCRHIANPMMLTQICSTLEKAGYKCPVISTPRELLAAMDPPDEIMQDVYQAREHLWRLGGGTLQGVGEYLRECGRRAKARGVLWIESEEEREAIGAEVRARLAREAGGAMCVGEEAGEYRAEEAHAEAQRRGEEGVG